MNKFLICISCVILYILLNSTHSLTETITFNKIFPNRGNAWFTSVYQTQDEGYIAVGTIETETNEKSDIWVVKTDNKGEIMWEKTYGDSGWDKANDIYQTKDGGFILIAENLTKKFPGRIVRIYKLNENGKISWERTFTFSDDNEVNSVIETSKGNYIIIGSLFFLDKKNSYLWVLKLDKKGRVLWNNTYGGTTWDAGHSICPTSDNGYIIAGITEDKETGLKNVWIVKLNEKGKKTWDKNYGRYYWDAAYSIQETYNGNYVAAGYTYSKKTKKSRMWILYLNKQGDIVWDKILGGDNWDGARSLQQTSDNKFIIAGFTKSKGLKGKNAWIVKIDENGDILWEKLYGDNNDDEIFSIKKTRDNGYILAGYTTSIEAEAKDCWLLKLDQNGDLIIPPKKSQPTTYFLTREKAYGTKNEDVLLCTSPTKDQGYILGGYTISPESGRDGLVIKFNYQCIREWQKIFGLKKNEQINSIIQTKNGEYIAAGHAFSKANNKNDFWVFKLDKSGKPLWSKTFGKENEDTANSICETADGGYIVAGTTYLSNRKDKDIRIIKLNQEGDKIWEKIYGGDKDDEACSILPAMDNEYLLAGNTFSKGEGSSDIWILKLDAQGEIIWENTYGEKYYEKMYSIEMTEREGYIISGYTRSEEGVLNYLIFRLSKYGNILWADTYNRSMYDIAKSTIQTIDGGFITAGTTFSGRAGGLDIWILRLDRDGNMIWNKTYGGIGKDTAGSIFQEASNKFIFSGSTSFNAKKYNDFGLIRFREQQGYNKIYIITDPLDAYVYVNNKFQGRSPVEVSGRTGMMNKLIIKKTNYYDINDGIVIDNKSKDRLFYKMKKKTGILQIFSHFPDIHLSIDRQDNMIIEHNKILLISLTPGKHELTFKKELSDKRTIPIEIYTNKTNDLIMLDDKFFKEGDNVK